MCKIINPNQPLEKTLEYMELNKNWSVHLQAYNVVDAVKCKTQSTKCKILRRGRYVLIKYNGIVHFWQKSNTAYPYFQIAIAFMVLSNPKKWETLVRLISLRQATKQTEVNCCDFVYDILQGRNLTLKSYKYFMKLARKQDYEHQGVHTF